MYHMYAQKYPVSILCDVTACMHALTPHTPNLRACVKVVFSGRMVTLRKHAITDASLIIYCRAVSYEKHL